MAAKYPGCFKPVSQDTVSRPNQSFLQLPSVSLSNEKRGAPGACPQACAAVSVPSRSPAPRMSPRSQCILSSVWTNLLLRRQRILHETLRSQSPAKRMVRNSKDRPFCQSAPDRFLQSQLAIAKNVLRVGSREAFSPQRPVKNSFLSFPKRVKLKLYRLFIIYKGM